MLRVLCSSYLLNGNGVLPAWPMRAACQPLAVPQMEGEELLIGLADSIGLFYNYSRDLDCYAWQQGPNPETEEDGLFWVSAVL